MSGNWKACLLLLWLVHPAANEAMGSDSPWSGGLAVTDFLPAGYVRDGSISYQPQIQRAIDAAHQAGKTLIFSPMTYLLHDEAGLTLHSHMTLVMHGAVLRFDRENRHDGQALLGHDVTDVQILGGEIAGQRQAWPDSVNIAGIRITGHSRRIRLRDLWLHDLSSNGVGIFGATDEAPIAEVFVENVVVRNCCNVFIDYLQPNTGPVPGSRREDQGGIACYYVKDFVVRGCTFDGSRSDGTHFYRCRDGQFTDNKVTGSTMGGYFLEACQHVLASGNLIRDNGSRGVTIERDSSFCTLVHNLIEHSGREGLWAPDVAHCLVAENVFRENGRKNHDGRDSEIKIEQSGKCKTVTEDVCLHDNLLYTTAHQDKAIWVTSGARGIIVERNMLRGPVRTICVDPCSSGAGDVRVRDNVGWKTEDAGVSRFSGDGKNSIFRIPHGLAVFQSAKPGVTDRLSLVPSLTAGSPAAAGPFSVSVDSEGIEVRYLTPPVAGQENVVLFWSVHAGGAADNTQATPAPKRVD